MTWDCLVPPGSYLYTHDRIWRGLVDNATSPEEASMLVSSGEPAPKVSSWTTSNTSYTCWFHLVTCTDLHGRQSLGSRCSLGFHIEASRRAGACP